MIDSSAQAHQQIRDDIAIVGMACIFPQAPDLKTFWRNILSKVDAISDPPDESLINLVHDPSSSATNRIYCNRGGYLKELPPFNTSDFGVMPVAIDGAEPEHFIALKVAYDALLDAGFPDKNFNREKTEVLLCRGTFVNRGYMTAMQHSVVVDQTLRLLKELHPHYSEETLTSLKTALMKQLPPFTPETAPGLCHNVMAGLIANRLNLQGRNLVLDAACASGLLAMEIGMDDLQHGKCDAVLVGGVQISTHAPIHMIFTQLGALSHQPHLKPFDKNADGTMLGEGIGMMVLKRLQDAIKDGHRIYAVIKGIGSSSDGRGSGLLAPRLEGEELAVHRAYQQARVDPATIELVEAHGTGIPLGDVTEIKALAKVLGRREPGMPKCAIGTIKSMIGHLIPAAGIAGMIKAALAVYHNVHPPTLYCDEPNPALELDKTPFFINTETRPWVHGSSTVPRRAAVSSFGFGGINAHAVIEEHRAPAGHKSISLDNRWDSELFVIEGQNRDKLALQCQRIRKLAEGLQEHGQTELADLAYSVNTSLSDKKMRLALVADSLADLQKKLGTAAKRLADPQRQQIKDRGGIFFFTQPLAREGGKLAFLFPGEGSQYVNMLADLCLHFPEARDCFDLLDKAYEDHPRGFMPSEVIFPANAQAKSASEEKIWQMDGAVDAVSTANRALFKIITSLGIVPDAILGHSSGELAALEASGAVILDHEEDVVGHIRTGNRIIEALEVEGSIPEGQLLAVGGVNYETTSKIAEADDDFLCIAMDNCPHQFVLCGTDKSIGRAATELKKAGGICQLLPFRRAYHTERFEPALKLLTGFFENGRFARPAIPLYSCMTAGLFPKTPAKVKEYAVRQWASPVLFRQTIEKMYDEGVRIFLEVGPRANLTGFVNDILGKKPFLAVASNVHHRSGITQLNHALGFLIAHGIPVKLEGLYQNRTVTKIDLKAPAQKMQQSPERGVKISLALPLLSLKDHGLQLPEQSAPVHSPVPEPSSPIPAPVDSRPTASAGAGMEEYFRTMENFLAMQEEVMTTYLSGGQLVQNPAWKHAGGQLSGSSVYPASGQSADNTALPSQEKVIASTDTQIEAMPKNEAAPEYFQAHSLDSETVKKLLLELVSEKTGYPPEMLDLEQNIEADLGIDSIKKVEILGALTRQLGERLSESQAEGLNRLTTLGQIIDGLARMQPEETGQHDETETKKTEPTLHGKAVSEESIRQALLDLVSEKTGYPQEMIELDQKLEADLGIDSIKRVEILGAFAGRFGSLPDEEAGKLNSLQTLQEIISFLTTHLAKPGHENKGSRLQAGEPQKEMSAEELAATSTDQRFPFFTTVVHELPGKEVTVRYDLDLENDLFLAHHTLGGEVSREDSKLLALPVMPFNMTVEIMAEVAGRLFPGKFLVTMENLLAHNWIIFENDLIPLTVKAEIKSEALQASVQLFLADEQNDQSGYRLAAEGIFSFADTFPKESESKPVKIKNPVVFTVTQEDFYPKALFHGPAFQTVESVMQCGKDGLEAILRRPAANGLFKDVELPDFLADPILLDGAGQAVGLWAVQNLAKNYVIFPVALEAAYFYSHLPIQTTGVNCRIQSLCSEESIASHIDLIADNHLYARLEGLQHKRIDMPEILHHFRGSRQVLLCSDWNTPLEPLADREKIACCRIDKAGYNFTGADGRVMRSVIAHIILNARERRHWFSLKGPETRKTEWLLGRLAAKEAVRKLLKRKAMPDVWSADIEITTDDNGKPGVTGEWLSRTDCIPLISIAHCNGTVVAVAAAGEKTQGIGIDVEAVRSLDSDFHKMAFTSKESAMISKNTAKPHEEWFVRLWCAKEAVAKALGRGMPGGPKDVVAIDIQPESGVINLRTANVLHQEMPELNKTKLVCYTLRENENIVALSIYPSFNP